MSSFVETWLVQEFADKGSLADAIKAGRFRRKLDGSLDTTAILKCLSDVASGAPAFVGFWHCPIGSNTVLLALRSSLCAITPVLHSICSRCQAI